jgi:hypothetical protein
MKLRQAAEIGFNYINHALVLLDQAYGDHPSMQKERQLIVDDLEAVQKALSERQECETCAAKRKKLTEAGLLKSPMRDVDMGVDRGAWDDVPNATQWVDELRGDEPELLNQTCCECGVSGGYALYCLECASKFAKREWVGLTDEDKESFWTADQMTLQEWNGLFDAIEAKLKEKNNG